MERKQPSRLRIILYIAGKDIVSAAKNRVTIGIIIGVLMLVLPSQLLPLILKTESRPTAVIYAQGAPRLAQRLAEIPETRAIQVPSIMELENEVVSRGDQVIGLIFPDGFSLNEGSQYGIKVTGHVPHWIDDEEMLRLVEYFEKQLNQLVTSDVQIVPNEDRVYPNEETHGFEVMFIIQMINAALMISLVLTPQLIMIEKETHTLDALLVSPASLVEMVIGKGIAGSVYSFLTTVLVIALNTSIIVHWGWLIISIISGIIFAVLIGLLIGLIFENFQKATLIMSTLVILILGPAFVKLFVRTTISPLIEFLTKWLPSGLLATLMQMSLFESVDLPAAWTTLGIIWIFNLILAGAIGLQIRKIIQNG